ncbi:MAG: adenosylmethionine--8-amino-7-oxononanoate transaminase [Actinomycetota bacterium]
MSRTDDLRASDFRNIWHPFTPHTVWFADDAPIIESGEGCWLIDTDGNRYLDGVSSLWVNTHGHSHPQIVRAIQEQAARLQHSTFLGLSHPPAIRLAERLIDLAPDGLNRVFFSENGAAAVEVALKMAYAAWKHRGEDRPLFVSLDEAYHGDTLGAVSVGGMELFHDTYRPLLFDTARIPSPNCYRCPLGLEVGSCGLACADQLDAVLTEHVGKVAAVITEPLVQGAAGIITAPDGHLARIAEITRAHGTLLIVDEIATGFGRTGRMFASEIDGVKPDLMTIGKGVTGGTLPLSATLATEELFEAFLGPPEQGRTLFHGHSYSANPLAAAAADATLDLFEAEETLRDVEARTDQLSALLKPLADHPIVGDVRQRGLMVGIELVADRGSKEPFDPSLTMGARVCREARKHGVIIRPLGDVVVLMPPLVISSDELTLLVEATAASIQAVAGEVG